jgi:hypothetical protein
MNPLLPSNTISPRSCCVLKGPVSPKKSTIEEANAGLQLHRPGWSSPGRGGTKMDDAADRYVQYSTLQYDQRLVNEIARYKCKGCVKEAPWKLVLRLVS